MLDKDIKNIENFMGKVGDKVAIYQIACNELAKKFLKKYFGDCDLSMGDFDWVGGEIGGVLHVNGYYFSMSDIYEALKLKATEEDLFEYYEYSTDSAVRGKPVNYNLKSFINLKHERSTQTSKKTVTES